MSNFVLVQLKALQLTNNMSTKSLLINTISMSYFLNHEICIAYHKCIAYLLDCASEIGIVLCIDSAFVIIYKLHF